MADQIKSTSSLPLSRPNDKLCATNFPNEILASLGQVFLSDAKGVHARGTSYIARITGNAGGKGYYTCVITTRRPTIFNPTTDLVAAKLANDGEVLEGYAYNLAEADQGTHVLTDAANVGQAYFRAYMEGYYASDGKPVVELVGAAFGDEDCT